MKTAEELEEYMQANKLANLELLQHSQRLAEHLRTQMDILLEVVRSSTEVYTHHVQFINQIIEQQKGRDNAKNEDSSTEEI